METNTQESCRGCVLKNRCVDGVVPHLSETEQCPCITCLVKMVCNDTCEKWTEYLHLSDIDL